jgi:hypothetical protein
MHGRDITANGEVRPPTTATSTPSMMFRRMPPPACRTMSDETLDRIDAIVPPGTEVADDSYQASPPALTDKTLRRRAVRITAL